MNWVDQDMNEFETGELIKVDDEKFLLPDHEAHAIKEMRKTGKYDPVDLKYQIQIFKEKR